MSRDQTLRNVAVRGQARLGCCISYLLLCHKPPQNLVAYSSNLLFPRVCGLPQEVLLASPGLTRVTTVGRWPLKTWHRDCQASPPLQPKPRAGPERGWGWGRLHHLVAKAAKYL